MALYQRAAGSYLNVFSAADP